jgi:hypothetical protein
MEFGHTTVQAQFRGRAREFPDTHLRPKNPAYHGETVQGDRWAPSRTVERLLVICARQHSSGRDALPQFP